MMKTGILTFHNVPNYGAALQAFALKTYLEEMPDNNVSVIDYQGHGNDDAFTTEKLAADIDSEPNLIKKVIKHTLFNCFYKKLHSSKYNKFVDFKNKYFNLKPISYMSDCNMLFYGSDQIWNPIITSGFDDMYFANTQNSSKSLNIAYAASCGDVDEAVKDKTKFLELLENFDFISVRENNLYKFLCENNVKCYNTVDPAFLIGKEKYIEKFKLSKFSDEKYVFIYELQKNKKLYKLAKKIAKAENLKIIRVVGYCDYRKNTISLKHDAGPIDFLNYIYNASYVITNSFHGTAFSVIFGKNFNTVLPDLRKSRLASLLGALDLTDRIYSDNDKFSTGPIDYPAVGNKLNEQIASSKQFINKVFTGEKNG